MDQCLKTGKWCTKRQAENDDLREDLAIRAIPWIRYIDKLISKLNKEDVDTYIIPLWINIIQSENSESHDVALNAFLFLFPYFNEDVIRTHIYSNLEKLFHESNSIKIKNQILDSIDRILTIVSPEYILSNIYPFIDSIKTSEAILLKTIINIYTHMLVKKDVLNLETLATRTTPTLLIETVNESLDPEQFRSLMDLIHMIFDRISQDRILQYQKKESLNLGHGEKTYAIINSHSTMKQNQMIIMTSEDKNEFVESHAMNLSYETGRRLSEQPRKQEMQSLLPLNSDIYSRRHSCALHIDNISSVKRHSSNSVNQNKPQSKPSSRRPSNSDLFVPSNNMESRSASGSRIKLTNDQRTGENLNVFMNLRRSSFNSLGNTVLDLFR